jgi:hypothetical protein
VEQRILAEAEAVLDMLELVEVCLVEKELLLCVI